MNFKSKGAYNKAQAYIHMHVHEGPSKHPYKVSIKGKSHKVDHGFYGETDMQPHLHHTIHTTGGYEHGRD